MTYSPLSIEIIKLLGSKELNQGCLIKITIPNGKKLDFYLMEKYNSDDIYRSFEIPVFGKMQLVTGDEIIYNKSIEIIGHIPNLQDLFIVGKRKGFTIDISNREEIEIPIRTYWGTNYREFGDIKYNFNKPLIEQTEETMNQLLTLFK